MKKKIFQCFLLLAPLIGCGEHKPSSSLNITNSRLAGKDEYPSVALLQRVGFPGSVCGGTFIGQGMVLTAAHCVYGKALHEIDTSIVLVPDEADAPQLISKSVRINETWVQDKATRNPEYASPYDLAIVEFEVSTENEVSTLTNSPTRPRTEVVLVGFGLASSTNGPYGKKRIGRNIVARPAYGLLIINGTEASIDTSGNANDSSATRGDSGSPLFKQGELAGIAVASSALPERGADSQYIDLNSNMARSFLMRFIDL